MRVCGLRPTGSPSRLIDQPSRRPCPIAVFRPCDGQSYRARSKVQEGRARHWFASSIPWQVERQTSAERLGFGVMRVVDLDRDMSDVIPTGLTPDSEFLFGRMTELTLDRTLGTLREGHRPRVLDVASGVGQDSIALAERGADVIGVEPSSRMTGMATLFAADKPGPMPRFVRGWSDRLPFPDASFDAAFCKGAMDHFDTPERAIEEMARVTRPDGRVVLAIANFESLACRVGRALDDFRQDWLRRGPLRSRRGYDAPSDHFTRYEPELIREQAERHLRVDHFEGVSLGWGMPGWSKWTARMPLGVARGAVASLDRIGRQWPGLSDVIVLSGTPLRSERTSA
ncbi:MAG: hypothetical protein CBC48_14980 [bacterium TMED88]|nr:hypothetical protein [Deltaproteobacteria bacterium]OUV26831.1 MAG: hypothetical protein CBC48_14980 [bacterium TMED88]